MLLKLSSILLSLAMLSPATDSPGEFTGASQSTIPLQILMEGDLLTIRLLQAELREWTFRMRMPIAYVDSAAVPYDLRIIVASDAASRSESCTTSCSSATCTDAATSATCSADVKIYFANAVGIKPDGKLQFTETGAGSASQFSITPLARKLAKWLSVLPKRSSTPSK